MRYQCDRTRLLRCTVRVSKVMLTHSTATAMLAAMDKHVVTAGSSHTVACYSQVACCHSNVMGGVH